MAMYAVEPHIKLHQMPGKVWLSVSQPIYWHVNSLSVTTDSQDTKNRCVNNIVKG